MKKYNIKKSETHTRIKSKKKCLTETRTCIDFFHFIKQKIM